MACLSNCNADASCGGFWLEITGSETDTGSTATPSPTPPEVTTNAPKGDDSFCAVFPDGPGCRRRKRQAGKARGMVRKIQ